MQVIPIDSVYDPKYNFHPSIAYLQCKNEDKTEFAVRISIKDKHLRASVGAFPDRETYSLSDFVPDKNSKPIEFFNDLSLENISCGAGNVNLVKKVLELLNVNPVQVFII